MGALILPTGEADVGLIYQSCLVMSFSIFVHFMYRSADGTSKVQVFHNSFRVFYCALQLSRFFETAVFQQKSLKNGKYQY